VAVRLGVECLLAGEAGHLGSQRLGLIHHPASVISTLEPSVGELIRGGFDLHALFGPQHGAHGDKQDNMVESDDFRDPTTGLPSYSLYGSVRRPTAEMLSGLDAVLFDLQDVGVRVYTFIWTMALAMEACAEAGVRFVVLDRPNPIGGFREGPLVRPGYESFVGLHPLPLRHGLTCGEIARWLNRERRVGCELEVIQCEGWERGMLWHETDLPWVMPSPNLPTVDSCAVYPGMVLLEGTNLSEGRGTTRPFELFGAPFLDPQALAAAIQPLLGPGVALRPCHFEPTFQKHSGTTCGGAQLHVTDPAAFQPVHTAVAILHAVRGLAPDDFRWREPPYEYETERAPIDILWGHEGLRLAVDAGVSPDAVVQECSTELEAFEASVAPDLLYT
jgi:uncharacterized protein YbbC (DUF1343 family)